MSTKSQHNNILLAIVVLVLVVLTVGAIGYFTLDEKEEIIQGDIEVSEFRVSCKYPGRILVLGVKEGDYVHIGDTLALLEIPEANAQEQVAEATKGAAEALSDLTDNVVREETVNSAYQVYQAAQAAEEIAERTYTRMQNLFDEGVVSAQKRDEALAAFKAATAQVSVTKSQWELAKSGSRQEEKRAAQKQVQAAQGAVNVVKSLLRETVQISQVEGEVESIFPKVGELVGLGSPIMNISLLSDLYATFNVREDQLNSMKVGDTFTAFVPAFNKNIELKVEHLKDQGSYATWKASKPSGQYDLKTFEVKARPTKHMEGLRPGMSIIIKKEVKKESKSLKGFFNFLKK